MNPVLKFALTTVILCIVGAWLISFLWGVGEVVLLLFILMIMGTSS